MSCTGMLAYFVAPRTFGRQLTWFDRTGKALGTIGGPRAFFDFEASPVWKRVAASVADSGNLDVGIFDLTRGLPTIHLRSRATGQLMAAEVTAKSDTVNVGAIRELVGGIEVGGEYFYDVTPDGQRILAAVLSGGPTSPPLITLVQNWITALKK